MVIFFVTKGGFFLCLIIIFDFLKLGGIFVKNSRKFVLRKYFLTLMVASVASMLSVQYEFTAEPCKKPVQFIPDTTDQDSGLPLISSSLHKLLKKRTHLLLWGFMINGGKAEDFCRCIEFLGVKIKRDQLRNVCVDEHGIPIVLYVCPMGLPAEWRADVQAFDTRGLLPNLAENQDSAELLLKLCSRKGNDIQEIIYLITCGISIEYAAADGPNPRCLHEAIEAGNDSIVTLLLESKADPKACDKKKWNPLHYASFYGRPKIVDTLLALNVSIGERTHTGYIARFI